MLPLLQLFSFFLLLHNLILLSPKHVSPLALPSRKSTALSDLEGRPPFQRVDSQRELFSSLPSPLGHSTSS